MNAEDGRKTGGMKVRTSEGRSLMGTSLSYDSV